MHLCLSSFSVFKEKYPGIISGSDVRGRSDVMGFIMAMCGNEVTIKIDFIMGYRDFELWYWWFSHALITNVLPDQKLYDAPQTNKQQYARRP